MVAGQTGGNGRGDLFGRGGCGCGGCVGGRGVLGGGRGVGGRGVGAVCGWVGG